MSYRLWRDRLAAANQPEFYPAEWLDQQIESGMSVPIIGEDAALVAGVRLYPGGARVGLVRAGCGDMDELIHELAPRAEQWGREHGCQLAMLEGRPGWQRALKEHGWRAHQVSLLKDL